MMVPGWDADSTSTGFPFVVKLFCGSDIDFTSGMRGGDAYLNHDAIKENFIWINDDWVEALRYYI